MAVNLLLCLKILKNLRIYLTLNNKLKFTFNYTDNLVLLDIMQNRITKLFQQKTSPILNIYYTAGFPNIGSTLEIAKNLQQAGVDLIEIGMPFSDPLADGPTIQQSSQIAIKNGMSIKILLEQLQGFRKYIKIPILLMGYLNPIYQYGVELFCKRIAEVGIDGLIIPDLPLEKYQQDYQNLFSKHKLSNIFLITPQTSNARIKLMDENSTGFLYVVSNNSTTGTENTTDNQKQYFTKIKNLSKNQLKNPCLIGFNIKDKSSFNTASFYASGAIVGSAFIKELQTTTDSNLAFTIGNFVKKIRGF